MPANDNITRLEDAGLLEPSSLTGADREKIEELTSGEVTLLIQVAKKLYPDDPSVLRTTNLKTGKLRIMFPL